MEAGKTIKIGFLGMGTVAQGVWEHLSKNPNVLGAKVELSKVCVRDTKKKRDVSIPPEKLTTNPRDVTSDPSIDIVCELMGGTTRAFDLSMEALRAGKVVVSANKAAICERGDLLFEEAKKMGSALFFEASVAGGVPVVKILREGLVANRFPLIYGILNGTCNYILTRMERENASYDSILADARRLGYVEADESLDIDGWDSAHKIAVLAYLAHGVWIKPGEQMPVMGIREVKLEDMLWAKDFDYRIKLVASVRKNPRTNSIFASVYPALVPLDDVIANVNGVYNAVSIDGDVVGRTVHIGRGAGRDATASAVIADIADAIKFLKGGVCVRRENKKLKLAKASEVTSAFYVRLGVKDRAGVLAKVAECFAKHGISIERLKQLARSDGLSSKAWLILTTHETSEQNMSDVCSDLKKLSVVAERPFVLRIFKTPKI